MIYITCFVYDFDGLQCACLTGATWHGALSQRSSMTVLYGSTRGRKGGRGCSEIEAPALSIITTKIFLQAQLSSHFPQSFTLNHLGVQVSAVRPRQPCACSPLPLPVPLPPSVPVPASCVPPHLPRRAAVTTMRPVEARKHLRILQISKATTAAASAAAPHLPLLNSLSLASLIWSWHGGPH